MSLYSIYVSSTKPQTAADIPALPLCIHDHGSSPAPKVLQLICTRRPDAFPTGRYITIQMDQILTKFNNTLRTLRLCEVQPFAKLGGHQTYKEHMFAMDLRAWQWDQRGHHAAAKSSMRARTHTKHARTHARTHTHMQAHAHAHTGCTCAL